MIASPGVFFSCFNLSSSTSSLVFLVLWFVFLLLCLLHDTKVFCMIIGFAILLPLTFFQMFLSSFPVSGVLSANILCIIWIFFFNYFLTGAVTSVMEAVVTLITFHSYADLLATIKALFLVFFVTLWHWLLFCPMFCCIVLLRFFSLPIA